MEIKWTDTDPTTGQRRFVAADRFAGRWTFRAKASRRGDDWSAVAPTRAIWETLLEALERRYRRREGVTDADLTFVRRALADFRDPPAVAEE
jgi:hypothetical protein